MVELNGDLAGAIGGTAGAAEPHNVIVNGTSGDDVVVADPQWKSSLGARSRRPGERRRRRLDDGLADRQRARRRSTSKMHRRAGGFDPADAERRRRGRCPHRRRRERHAVGGPATTSCSAGRATMSSDGGGGDDVVIDSLAANSVTSATRTGTSWLKAHAHIVNGKTVIDVGEKKRTLPRAEPLQARSGRRFALSAKFTSETPAPGPDIRFWRWLVGGAAARPPTRMLDRPCATTDGTYARPRPARRPTSTGSTGPGWALAGWPDAGGPRPGDLRAELSARACSGVEDDLGYLLRALRNTFLTQKRTEGRRLRPGPLPARSTSSPIRSRAREPQAALEAHEAHAAMCASRRLPRRPRRRDVTGFVRRRRGRSASRKGR